MQKTILSTADVARLFNVTETTVKRWANDGTLRCTKTPGGHRKFEMRHVVDFAQTLNIEPCGTLALSEEDELAKNIQLAILSRDFKSLTDAFLEKALSPDKHDVFVFFAFLYQHKIHLWQMYDLIVRPGMAEIGKRWESGEVTIDQEHRASYEILDALARLQTEINVQPPNGLRMLAACPGEEPHEIGLRCTSYFFESEGWKTDYLGARTPWDSILSASRELRPNVVCLSRTSPLSDLESIAMQSLLAELAAMKIPVFLGGSAIGASFAVSGALSINTASELMVEMKKLERDLRVDTIEQ